MDAIPYFEWPEVPEPTQQARTPVCKHWSFLALHGHRICQGFRAWWNVETISSTLTPLVDPAFLCRNLFATVFLESHCQAFLMVSMSPTRTTNKCQAFFDLYSAIVNKGRRLVRCQYFTQNPFCWNQSFLSDSIFEPSLFEGPSRWTVFYSSWPCPSLWVCPVLPLAIPKAPAQALTVDSCLGLEKFPSLIQLFHCPSERLDGDSGTCQWPTSA